MNTLTILGCNSALPTSERFSAAQVLEILGRLFLIDCGEGTQMQLRKMKVNFARINHIFISHLHGDHYLGLFGMLSSFNLLGRKHTLTIYGPKELEEIVNFQMRFLSAELTYQINFVNIETGASTQIYEDKRLTVTTIPLRHRIPTYGFLFREKPKPRNIHKEAIEQYHLSISDIVKIKEGADLVAEDGQVIPNNELTTSSGTSASYAYCSDTNYYESIIPIIKEVDLLFHEATFMHEMLPRAKETFHTTALQAGTIAQKANVKRLVIGHYSARFPNPEPLLLEAQSVFPNTIAAKDGLIIDF